MIACSFKLTLVWDYSSYEDLKRTLEDATSEIRILD